MRTSDDRRPDAIRARRAIVLALGFYVCGQLAVGIALDHAPLKVRFAQAAGVLRKAAALDRPPDVLILGSSRFRASVLTDVMEDALRTGERGKPPMLFNGAVEAGDAYAMDLVLRGLLAGGARPRLAIIEISPETVAMRNNWSNAHIARQLTLPEEAARLRELVLSRKVGDLVSARLNTVYFYRQELLTWITGRKPPYLRVPGPDEAARARSSPENEEGVAPEAGEGEPREAEEEFRRRAGRGARHIRKWLRSYEISGLAAESLDRLLERCRAHGIEVILLRPPVAGVHRVVYTAAIESAFRVYVTDLMKRYGVRYVDYQARLPDALFLDNHHTNAEGARTFSRMLAQEVVATAWPGASRRGRVTPGEGKSPR